MSDKVVRQYGLWDSPISARSLATSLRLHDVGWDSDGETLVWLEGRSDRGVLAARNAGRSDAARDLTSDLSVRARVGYGGGDFCVAHGSVYFVDSESGRLFRQELASGVAVPITPRFGLTSSPQLSPDGRFVIYLHHDEASRQDRLAVVDSSGRSWPQILAEGHDFYSHPRFSPDGRYLAYITWDHPEMPWDGTKLYLAPIIYDDKALPRLGEPRLVAGSTSIAVQQPEFSADGRFLTYVSDASGFGQIYRYDLKDEVTRQLTHRSGAEHATPAWVHDLRTYALSPDGSYLMAAVGEAGFVRLYKIDLASGSYNQMTDLSAYTDVSQLSISRKGRLAFIGSSAVLSPRVVSYDLAKHTADIMARASGETLDPKALSQPEALSWETAGGEQSHGLYYPPHSNRFQGTDKPPLLVMIHGGPTAQAKAGWSPQAQYFATRGYGVLYVNYRGSTGYGRDYMMKLRGNWGLCDVEDAVSGARFLSKNGRVDGQRMIIMGGSAGGFTVLQTMVTHPEIFAAGVSLYGVANQFTLIADTHKFEERYSESLLGALPEAAEKYRERSPVFHASKIKRPLAVFQGGKDKVVPQEQAETIVRALQRSSTPHVYHLYPDEGHGWRKVETVEHFYKALESFLKESVLFS